MARPLPPLNAIKAFEAVARLGSISGAARELGVTPGAVSQQIRLLADFFDKRLFLRRHNRLQLTDAGLSVYADTSEIIDRLATMTERLLQGEARSRFVISTLPSVASGWINTWLSDFLDASPGVRCELRVEDDPIDFLQHHIDLRLCYGEHLYPAMVTRPLVRDEVMPLCSPTFLERAGLDPANPADISDDHLIHVDWGATFASYPTWSEWFQAAGLERQPRRDRGHKCDMSNLALQLAAGGAGIVLGQRLLARRELEAGRLVAPFDLALPLPHAYCTVFPHAKAERVVLQRFLARLAKEVEGGSNAR